MAKLAKGTSRKRRSRITRYVFFQHTSYSPIYPADERLQQEVGESLGRAVPVLRPLQFLPDSFQHPRDSCDASGDRRSRVGTSRTLGVISSSSMRTQAITLRINEPPPPRTPPTPPPQP